MDILLSLFYYILFFLFVLSGYQLSFYFRMLKSIFLPVFTDNS